MRRQATDRPGAASEGQPDEGARAVTFVLRRIASAIHAAVDELGRLDAVVGDGDHGAGMARGIDAAVVVAPTAASAGRAIGAAGAAFGDAAGGASGALWCGALLAMGRVIGDRVPAGGCPGVADIRAALVDALGVVRRLGGAEVGDRTLVDALAPFVDAFPSTAPSLAQAWSDALPPMRTAAEGTARLVPRKGRAATHGAKALGTVDAGARSLAMALDAAGEALRELDAGTGGEA